MYLVYELLELWQQLQWWISASFNRASSLIASDMSFVSTSGRLTFLQMNSKSSCAAWYEGERWNELSELAVNSMANFSASALLLKPLIVAGNPANPNAFIN